MYIGFKFFFKRGSRIHGHAIRLNFAGEGDCGR